MELASHATEVSQGMRMAFGANWARFLNLVDEERISAAVGSLTAALGHEIVAGKTFLDIGSGSGLFSLAARRLGAHVHSFDYDPQSVACTAELKRRYHPDDPEWIVEEGNVLDRQYLEGIGRFDIVYSFGVLHHTGAMWLAIENAMTRVTNGGTLFLALYNDQGWKSHFWWFVKFVYNSLPAVLRPPYAYSVGALSYLANILKYTFRGEPMKALRPLMDYKRDRGMSVARDIVDWTGGFPYEFVRAEILQTYVEAHGFRLVRAIPETSLGCHQMTFVSTERYS